MRPIRAVAAVLGGVMVMAFGLVAGGVGPAFGGGDDKITICHAAGQEGTTTFVTLHLPEQAVFGQGGHFNENGTPQAGHEDDYMGPCNNTPPTTTGEEECDESSASTQYDPECPPDETETTPTEPTDVCTNLGGAQSTTPPGYKNENGICSRVCPDGLPPTPGEGAYDPNDDCKRPPPVTTTTTTTTPTPAVTTTTTPTTTTPTTTTPTPTTTPPKTVAPKPKPKTTSKPKTVKPKTTTPKPDAPKVCKTLADGTKRAWHKGGNGLAAGCYAIVMGSY